MDAQRIEEAAVAAITNVFTQDPTFVHRVREEATRQLVSQVKASTLPTMDFKTRMQALVEAEVESELGRQKAKIAETADQLVTRAWNSRAGQLASTIEHHIRASIKDALANAIRRKLSVRDGTLRFEDVEDQPRG